MPRKTKREQVIKAIREISKSKHKAPLMSFDLKMKAPQVGDILRAHDEDMKN